MVGVLRVTNSDLEDSSAYRVVLTPTCDLVPRGTPAKAKVEVVLAVKSCSPAAFAIKGLQLSAGTAEKKFMEKLAVAFNDPHQAGFAVLPAFPGVMPLLGLDFRDLEVIPFSEIATINEAGKRFMHLASVDSLREYLAWAFLQINCRPGIPPRNMESVAKALYTSCNPPTVTDSAK